MATITISNVVIRNSDTVECTISATDAGVSPLVQVCVPYWGYGDEPWINCQLGAFTSATLGESSHCWLKARISTDSGATWVESNQVDLSTYFQMDTGYMSAPELNGLRFFWPILFYNFDNNSQWYPSVVWARYQDEAAAWEDVPYDGYQAYNAFKTYSQNGVLPTLWIKAVDDYNVTHIFGPLQPPSGQTTIDPAALPLSLIATAGGAPYEGTTFTRDALPADGTMPTYTWTDTGYTGLNYEINHWVLDGMQTAVTTGNTSPAGQYDGGVVLAAVGNSDPPTNEEEYTDTYTAEYQTASGSTTTAPQCDGTYTYYGTTRNGHAVYANQHSSFLWWEGVYGWVIATGTFPSETYNYQNVIGSTPEGYYTRAGAETEWALILTKVTGGGGDPDPEPTATRRYSASAGVIYDGQCY